MFTYQQSHDESKVVPSNAQEDPTKAADPPTATPASILGRGARPSGLPPGINYTHLAGNPSKVPYFQSKEAREKIQSTNAATATYFPLLGNISSAKARQAAAQVIPSSQKLT